MSILDNIIAEPKPGAPKGIVYGPPGIGKTTFGASAGNAIIIDCEHGANQVQCQRTPYLQTWHEIARYLEALENEDHGFGTIVIDTLDWLLRRLEEHVAGSIQNMEQTLHRSHGGYGNGRLVLANHIYGWLLPQLDRLVAKGLAVLLLAHANVSSITDEDGVDVEKVAPDIPSGKRGQQSQLAIFTEWSDFVCLAKQGDGQRVLLTQETPNALAKNRYGLQPVIPFTWAAFAQAIGEGLSQTWNKET